MQDVVEQAKRGDRHAYAQLVERYGAAAVATGYSLLGNLHDAEEVAQEALFHAWRTLPKLRDPARFPAWLLRIVRTRASNFRTRWRQDALPLEGVDVAAFSSEGRQDRAAQAEADALDEALATLSPGLRSATTLFYLGGYGIDDVASLLEVPVGTVKRRLHEARDQLKDVLPTSLRRGLRLARPGARMRLVPLVLPDLPRARRGRRGTQPPEHIEKETLMDVTVAQDALGRALAGLGRLAKPDSEADSVASDAAPSADTLRFAAAADRLTVTRASGDVRLTTSVPAAVVTAGTVTVPSALFPYDSVLSTQGEMPKRNEPTTGKAASAKGTAVGRGSRGSVRRRQVQLSVVLAAGGALALQTAARRVRVSGTGITARDDPALFSTGEVPSPPVAAGHGYTIDAGQLRRGLAQVSFAADHVGRKPLLGAVLLEFGANELELTATDGFRIARSLVPLFASGGLQESAALIGPVKMAVPLAAVNQLTRLVAGLPAAASVHVTAAGEAESRASVDAGGMELSFRPMGDAYPDLTRVFPQSWRTRVAVETAELRSAVRATTLFGSTNPLLVEARADALSLYAPGGRAGDAEAGLPAAGEGDTVRAVLSSELLLPLLDAASTEHVEMQFTSSHRAVVVKEIGRDARATWALQPMDAPGVMSHLFTT